MVKLLSYLPIILDCECLDIVLSGIGRHIWPSKVLFLDIFIHGLLATLFSVFVLILGSLTLYVFHFVH